TDAAAVAADGLTTRFRATRETVLASPYVLLGSIGEICETLRERRERHGISYLSIFEDDADAIAPVVGGRAGTWPAGPAPARRREGQRKRGMTSRAKSSMERRTRSSGSPPKFIQHMSC